MLFVEKATESGIQFKDSYHRQYVLRELYVKLFELHDPKYLRDDPLDVVTMPNKEGHMDQCGPLASRNLDYRICKIKDKFGYNFSEWVDLPRYEVFLQMDIALKEIAAENAKSSEEHNLIDSISNQFNITDPAMKAELRALLKSKK